MLISAQIRAERVPTSADQVGPRSLPCAGHLENWTPKCRDRRASITPVTTAPVRCPPKAWPALSFGLDVARVGLCLLNLSQPHQRPTSSSARSPQIGSGPSAAGRSVKKGAPTVFSRSPEAALSRAFPRSDLLVWRRSFHGSDRLEIRRRPQSSRNCGLGCTRHRG